MRGGLEALRALARDRDGECLFEGRLAPTSVVRWRCAKGHVWETLPSVVIGGGWCPECEPGRRRRRWSLELMQAIAGERGGECLSIEYRHFSEPLRWRCAKGHVWEAKPGGIVNVGTWCRRCAGKGKHSLEEVRALARERGGQCLSSEYVNTTTPLRWRCAVGHEWRAAFGNVRGGTWCPKCAVRNPLSIEEMRSVALARGGACLSDEYVNPRVKLRWRCAEGHEWNASGFTVARKGQWCRVCAGRLEDGLERIRASAQARGGVCLAERYEGIDAKVGWQCASGHTWEAAFHNLESNGS